MADPHYEHCTPQAQNGHSGHFTDARYMLQNDENLYQGQENVCSTRRNLNGHMAQGGYENPVDLSSKLINVNGYIKSESVQNGGYQRERTPIMGSHREQGQ